MQLITGKQCRMARASTGWRIKDLQRHSGVSLSTIQKIEKADGVPSVRIESLQAIRNAFEGETAIVFRGETCVYDEWEYGIQSK